MEKKKRDVLKAGRGIQLSDVSNPAIRHVLLKIGEEIFGQFNYEKQEEALKFFDYKCPYTGRLLVDENDQWTEDVQLDHIVPQNRESCGFNATGNLIVVAKKANSKKGSKSFEEFLRHNDNVEGIKDAPIEVREKRIEKIKKFHEQYNGSIDIDNQVKSRLYLTYSKVQKLLKSEIETIKGLIKISTLDDEKYVTKNLISTLRDMLESGCFSSDEIEKFMQEEYTKEHFGIHTYPLLRKTKEKSSSHPRYYKTPVIIEGEVYYLTNHWLKNSKQKLVEVLKSKEYQTLKIK